MVSSERGPIGWSYSLSYLAEGSRPERLLVSTELSINFRPTAQLYFNLAL